MVRLRNTERQCIGSECSQDQAGSRNMVAAKGKAGGPRRLPTHHIEKTQWSPTWNVICLGNGLPWTTIANLCRNRVQHLEAVGTFPPAYLPCHPCQSLCSVLDGQTVSGVARIPRVGSFEMKGKWDLCHANRSQLCLPFLSWAVFALGTEFMLRGVWGDKARLFEDRGHPWEAHYLAVLWEE